MVAIIWILFAVAEGAWSIAASSLALPHCPQIALF
ncbi:hypothetical protein FOXYSP1_13920 [Fusarium oxysporum f. sp. phaseoli]